LNEDLQFGELVSDSSNRVICTSSSPRLTNASTKFGSRRERTVIACHRFVEATQGLECNSPVVENVTACGLMASAASQFVSVSAGRPCEIAPLLRDEVRRN
jgi:hypothetical protein